MSIVGGAAPRFPHRDHPRGPPLRRHLHLRRDRFELPWRYRTVRRVTIQVARWDLSSVDLCDPRSGAHLAVVLPLDKSRNADGQRRAVPKGLPPLAAEATPAGIAPHLRRLMADYAATGLPPAYLPKDQGAAEIADLDRDLDGDGDLDGDRDLDSGDQPQPEDDQHHEEEPR